MPLMISVPSSRLLATTLVVLILTGCDGGFYLTARVVDSEGHPIQGAKVHASSKKSPRVYDAISDESGCFTFGWVEAPRKYDFTIVAHASGYKPLGFVASTAEDNYFQFVLATKAQAFTSQAQAADEAWVRDNCGGI